MNKSEQFTMIAGALVLIFLIGRITFVNIRDDNVTVGKPFTVYTDKDFSKITCQIREIDKEFRLSCLDR